MTLLTSGNLNVAECPIRGLERDLGRSICPVAIALTSNGDVQFRAVLEDTLIQYCSAKQDNLEKNKRASWHRRSVFGRAIPAMPAAQISVSTTILRH
jgi:hypothetical protein